MEPELENPAIANVDAERRRRNRAVTRALSYNRSDDLRSEPRGASLWDRWTLLWKPPTISAPSSSSRKSLLHRPRIMLMNHESWPPARLAHAPARLGVLATSCYARMS